MFFQGLNPLTVWCDRASVMLEYTTQGLKEKGSLGSGLGLGTISSIAPTLCTLGMALLALVKTPEPELGLGLCRVPSLGIRVRVM